MKLRQILCYFLIFVLLIATSLIVTAQVNPLENNKDSLKSVEKDGIKIFNMPTESSKNTDIRIVALVKKANSVILHYRNNKFEEFKTLEMKNKYSHSKRYYEAIIPADDTDADYIEYYITANVSEMEVKSDIQTIKLIDMSIGPLEGISDQTNNDEFSILTDSSLRRYFNDVAASDGVFSGFDLDNFNESLSIPQKGATSWPDVNSKWNQPRTDGTNPHKGLDLKIPAEQVVVPILNGYLYYVERNEGKNNYVAVKYDLQKVDHNNGYDLIVYYFHIDPKDSIPNNVQAGITELGTVRSDANHLHISIRDKNGFDLPQYYFFKNISSLDYGYKVDLVHGPVYSGRTVKFRGYVYDNISGKQSFANVYINYMTETSGLKTALMTRSGDEYSYTFPSQYTGQSVAYYLSIYRSGLPSGMVAFSPAYYNIYYDSSTGKYISTPPPWSATYSWIIP